MQHIDYLVKMILERHPELTVTALAGELGVLKQDISRMRHDRRMSASLRKLYRLLAYVTPEVQLEVIRRGIEEAPKRAPKRTKVRP